MTHPSSTTRRNGFALIEALVALLIIAFGVVGITKLQTLSIFGASEAKARSEAMALSQVKLENLRNLVEKSKFTGDPMLDSATPETHNGQYASYSMSWTVEAPVAGTPQAGLEQRVLELKTTWTDSRGGAQEIVLNSVIAWDDPSLQASASAGLGGSLISPTGAAKRMVKNIPGQTGVYTDPTTKNTYLLNNNGDVLLYLPPLEGQAQKFATISGKIFFDQNAGNRIPNSSDVRVRLSSEGECIYNNTSLSAAVTSGSNSYKYFSYTCYVGPGWYGNVGVLVDEDVNGNAADPTICIGDPGFNNGASDGTLVSAHPLESATRSYRGFKGTAGNYRSTGMQGDSAYGLTTGTTRLPPFDGRPRPSEYPSYYSGVTVNSDTDYFEQNFLLTKTTGNNSCMSKMSGGVFTSNAGKYVCISPDNDNAGDVCPVTWPGFESQVGTGNGSINYAITVTTQGSGTVTSNSGGINCGSLCSASYPSGSTVTLTATPLSGATFSSWTGCTSAAGATCTVTVDALKAVTANFTGGASDSLTVTKGGTGSGTVTSSPSGINCGATCSSSFSNGTSVTLSAAASSGSTFTGWSGNCTGTGSCTVSVAGATSVVANFALSGGQVCTTPISGSAVDKHGAVTATASACATTGNSCSCAMDGGSSSNYSCSLTLPQGTVVTLTNVRTSGNPTYSHTKSVTANCSGQTNVNFQ